MQVLGRSISSRSVEIILVTGVVLCAAILRLMDLTTTSLWQDEAVSWAQSDRSFYAMLVETSRDNYPPLHNMILNVVIRYFGDSEIALRLPSVIFGTLAVYMTFLIGKAISGVRVGIGGAILVALSVFHIWYSMEARNYALLSLTSAVFFFYALRATQGKLEKGYLTLAGMALLYSHVYGAIMFVSINLSVLLIFATTQNMSKEYMWNWLKSQLIAFAAFLPWLVILAKRSLTPDSSGFGWLPALNLEVVELQVLRLLGNGLTAAILLFFVALAVVWAVFAPSRWSSSLNLEKTEENRLRQSVFLLLAWFGLPILIGSIISIAFAPLLISRYLIGGIVPIMLLAAIGFYLLNLTKPFAIASAILIVMAIAPSREEFAYPNFRFEVRPDMAQFNALQEVGDTVYFRSWHLPLFIYYAAKPAEINIKPPGKLPADSELPKRFWMVDLADYRPEDGLVAHLESLGYSVKYRTKTKYLFSLFVKETGQ